VDETASLFAFLLTRKESEIKKHTPQIKASLDKNNSQRIGDFRLK
jgi:hypothetical protein